jgi:SHS2 domain-containing protein
VHAVLRGEPFDLTRHPRGTLVKAATLHGLEVKRAPGRVSARVVLDI